MKEQICKSQRTIVEELIQEHINLSEKIEELEKAGIQIDCKFLNMIPLFDWALDVIGFPQDTTGQKNRFANTPFIRDYIDYSTLLKKEDGTRNPYSVKEIVDILYLEFENLKKKAPALFL